jgi:hypothetical protein
MTTSQPTALAPHFAAAGTVVEAIANHDFARLSETLDEAATMSALLPRGFDEWHGPRDICAAFDKWFGDVDEFEVVDASVGQVGALLHLRWRVRVQGGPRFPDAPKVAEQNVYATTNATGRIDRMRLLCSGFCDEHLDD